MISLLPLIFQRKRDETPQEMGPCLEILQAVFKGTGDRHAGRDAEG